MILDELRRLYEDDGALRREGLRLRVLPRMVWADWRHRRRVKRLLKDGLLEAPEDYYHAAMILQHSLAVADYSQAHQLAMRAVELGYTQGRWLAAATLDRWLMRQGKPQKHGTQYTMVGARWKVWAWGKRFRLWDVDPATSDAERAEWGVPALEVAREWAATVGDVTATGWARPLLSSRQVTSGWKFRTSAPSGPPHPRAPAGGRRLNRCTRTIGPTISLHRRVSASAGLATRSASLEAMVSCRSSGSSSRCSLASPTRTLGDGRIPRRSRR